MPDDLMATCWTYEGAVRPLDEPEVGPVSAEERVAAVIADGRVGIRFAQRDLEVALGATGFTELGRAIRDAGLCHVEVELLGDWSLDDDVWRP